MVAGRRANLIIVSFALFVIGLTWTAPTLRIRAERRDAIRAATSQNVNRSIALQQYVSRTLEAAEIAAEHVIEAYRSGTGSIHRGSYAAPTQINDPIAKNTSFLGVSVVNEEGDLIASTLGRRAASQNVSEHEAFTIHRTRRSNALYVSKPAFSDFFGRQVIWLTRRIDKADGSFGGAVAINISPEQFMAIYDDVSVEPSDVMSLIGLDGVTRARRTGAQVSAGENLSGKLVMRMQRRNPNGTYLGPSALDGLVRYFSHRRLSDYPLFATYGVLQDKVLEPVRTRATFLYLVAALVTAITAAFALTLIRMIARRDRQTAELIDANRRLEEAQRVAQIGDWELDLRAKAFRWSAQMYRMYGRDEAVGPPTLADYEAYLNESSRTLLAAALGRAIDTHQPQSLEVVVQRPGRADNHRLVSIIPTSDGKGNVVQLHGTDQDLSARKRLDHLEAEVAHLSRLEAMNAMAATLAHELNQPLAAASNFLAGTERVLMSSQGIPERVIEGVEGARLQVRFAGQIIRRVRAMVTKERKMVRAVSITDVIDDALRLALAGDRDSIEVRKEIEPGASVVHADHIQLQQVLLNLIRNAREAMAMVEAPRITIRTAPAPPDHVRVSVEDNGAGYEGDAARLFAPFSSESENGLGLGLSISRTIIESHGGRIWAEKGPDVGTRVSFTVPITAEASAH